MSALEQRLPVMPLLPNWRQHMGWILALLGLLLLYVPSYINLFQTLWQSDDNIHGPMVLMVSLYLIWTQVPKAIEHTNGKLLLGGSMLVFGLLMFILGRSQSIYILEIGSHIPVLGGVVLMVGGWSALRLLAFPILFMVFMVPLPGSFVDAVTGPLKQHISEWADNILYFAGFPVSRSGVILNIGQYQLLVADACSGLHSMFTLSALGVLYLHLAGRKGWLHNGLIAASILPIAFFANVTRVMVLVLVTYFFGDEAGRGFIHGFAGILLFIVALLMLFLVDGLLARFTHRRASELSMGDKV